MPAVKLPETGRGSEVYNLLACIDQVSQALDLEADSDLVVKVSLYDVFQHTW